MKKKTAVILGERPVSFPRKRESTGAGCASTMREDLEDPLRICRSPIKAFGDDKRPLRALAMTASLVTLLAFPAFAGEYDIKEMTPAVQRAIQERQARYAQLEPFKQEGVLGEDNQGFVRALKESPEASALAETENGDRQVIYRAIVDQNGLGSGGMAQVQSIFAEVQRGKAKPGEWIQSRAGEWNQK